MTKNEASKKERISADQMDRYAFFFVILEDVAHKQNCEVWLHSDKTRVSKGYPFGTLHLEQRCSVLFLLARLVGKKRVSTDGNVHFDLQESGLIFANVNE